MIDRQHGRLVLTCDSCDEEFDGDWSTDEFDDMWDAAKLEGWAARKIAREWQHGCPDCGPPT